MEAYIETPRLILRAFCMQDAQSMFNSYCGDEEAARYMPWYAHENVQQTERDLRERLLPRQASDDWLPLAIAEKQRPGHVIGNIGAFLNGDVAELGYVLGRAWWNKGYMSEALAAMVEHLFTYTPVQSIAAWYEWANPASGAVMKKCGFVYEKEFMDKRKADSPPQDTVPCAYCRLWRGQWAACGGKTAYRRRE